MGKTIQITTLGLSSYSQRSRFKFNVIVLSIGTLFIKAKYSKKNRDQHLIFGGNYADDSGKAYYTCIK